MRHYGKFTIQRIFRIFLPLQLQLISANLKRTPPTALSHSAQWSSFERYTVDRNVQSMMQAIIHALSFLHEFPVIFSVK